MNARFDSPQAGYAAMEKLLDVYGTKHGLNTVAGIIGRWAPAGADNNDTSGYVSYVAKRLGIDPNAPLTPEARAKLPEAMAYIENARFANKNLRPCVPVGRSDQVGVIWFRGAYSHYTALYAYGTGIFSLPAK